MPADTTIIYYTANQEDPVFEQRIIADLVSKSGDMPIISVSRKPMDLGTNICIGEKPISYTTEWKQLLLGLQAAKTKFCLAAESDCLYPPDYFSFNPPRDDMMFNYNNIWMIWKYKGGFWKKTGYCEGAQICGRDYWIKQLAPLLPEKWEPLSRPDENALVNMIFPERREWSGQPMLSFKTRDGVSCRTTFDRHSKTRELPYWGRIEKVMEIFA